MLALLAILMPMIISAQIPWQNSTDKASIDLGSIEGILRYCFFKLISDWDWFSEEIVSGKFSRIERRDYIIVVIVNILDAVNHAVDFSLLRFTSPGKGNYSDWIATPRTGQI